MNHNHLKKLYFKKSFFFLKGSRNNLTRKLLCVTQFQEFSNLVHNSYETYHRLVYS